MQDRIVPSRLDPCWEDSEWRRAALQRIADQIGRKAIISLTQASPNSVKCWLSVKHSASISPKTLRLLMIDMQEVV